MPKIYLVTISIFTDDGDSPERIQEDLETVLTGEFSWGHIDVKPAKVVVD